MSAVLKQSTSRHLMIFIGSIVDRSQGQAGLSASITVEASKNGGAFSDITAGVTITDRSYGWYDILLSNTHTDTVGDLVLHITATGGYVEDVRCQVSAFDLETSTVVLADGSITSVKFGAGAITAAVIATDAIDADALADGAITAATFAAGAIDASAIAADAITAAKIAADAVTEIQSGLATTANVAAVETDTQDIQSRLPAALVAGRMDSSVGAMAADTITAAAVAADAVAEIQSGLATTANVSSVETDTQDIQSRLPAALVAGRIDANVGAMGAGVVTAAAVATDAIDADAISASAVAEIQNGLVTSVDLNDINTKLDTLEAVAVGRWRVLGTQLILYQLDGTTPLATFNLFDSDGNPSSTRIFERVPV